MQLTHKIQLKPTTSQIDYFKKAAGTARFTWNWALNEWQLQYAAGQKPNVMALKKKFNAIKYQEFPWLKEVHRDSHAQPFTYLGNAWDQFFADIKAKKVAHEPRFKKKNKARDSFYVANDKFRFEDDNIILPKLGKVLMCERLRFEGKILGATVSRTADNWFIAIQVEVPEKQALKQRTSNGIVGVDLGVTAAATFSTGEKIYSPKPLKTALRRLKMRSRDVSRKIEAAKKCTEAGLKLPLSNNRKKSSLRLAKLHQRIANLRADFSHKLTTRLCRENQTVVIEDLYVKGMVQNDKLARAIQDVGFGTIRRQLEYKSKRYSTKLIIADRWYPSSKLCSECYVKNGELALEERTWICSQCKTVHDREINAAKNLERLATETALPVAIHLVTEETGLE